MSPDDDSKSFHGHRSRAGPAPPGARTGSAAAEAVDIIFRNIEDVVYQLDVEGPDTFRFSYVNPAFYKATHLEPDQVIGKTID